MFREAGFTILEESSVPGEPTADVINNVAAQFRKYESADLFALKGRISARQLVSARCYQRRAAGGGACASCSIVANRCNWESRKPSASIAFTVAST